MIVKKAFYQVGKCIYSPIVPKVYSDGSSMWLCEVYTMKGGHAGRSWVNTDKLRHALRMKPTNKLKSKKGLFQLP